MKENRFDTTKYEIETNDQLREPQRDGFIAIRGYFEGNPVSREIGIVLPVGCGKSGLITLSPFSIKSKRTLVLAPGLRIKRQLFDDFDPANPGMFYQKCQVIEDNFPEPAIIDGKDTNVGDLEAADVVVTNIHQIQGEENVWLDQMPEDFFDLILVDEAHHNVAESWTRVRRKFPLARIVNFSATPTRADGRRMEGDIIYSFPIFRAMELGYVKKLKAKVLNPSTLKYVRHEGGAEIEVSLQEIIELGEADSPFRRSIVSSDESLSTIVDCSIRELQNIRAATGDVRHKIIASALHYSHCAQITAAYEERGLRAAYIHSNEEGATNNRILERLANHELDVIVQVRMLSEGFDHPYLSVAAVCSVFSNLSPFAQFVGRIMRVIDQNAPNSPNNKGVVVFHAGSNIANRWSDFREFSEADQEYFDQLLPLEDINFDDSEEVAVEPRQRTASSVRIMEQETVTIEEIPLVEIDEDSRDEFTKLRSRLEAQGIEVVLRRIPVTKQRKRQASRKELDSTIKIKAGEVLNRLNLNPRGFELDRSHLGKTNFVIVKSKIDKKVNELVGRGSGERNQFSQSEVDKIEENLENLTNSLETEIKNGAS